jgi:xanthine dehydrogenase YagS FAD-binding subunit
VAERSVFAQAAAEELAGARTRPLNAFKAELARRTMVRALEAATVMGDGS